MNIKDRLMINSAGLIRTLAIIASAKSYILPLMNKGFSLDVVTEAASVILLFEIVHILFVQLLDMISDKKISRVVREYIGSVGSSIVCCTIVCAMLVRNL